MTETSDKPDKRAILRWILLALGIVAILFVASTTGMSDQEPRRPVTIQLDPALSTALVITRPWYFADSATRPPPGDSST